MHACPEVPLVETVLRVGAKCLQGAYIVAIDAPAFLVGPFRLMKRDVETHVVTDRTIVLLRSADLAQQIGRVAEHIMAGKGLRAALAPLLRDKRSNVVENEAIH